MLLSAVTGRLYGLAKGLAKVYLHNETVDLTQEMLLADSIPGAAEAFIGAASADGRALLADFVVVLGALIIVVALPSCLVRFFCWLCIGTSIKASSIEKVHAHKKSHQIQSQRERAEHKRRRNKVEEKASAPAQQNLPQVSEDTRAAPKSILRGFPEVDILLTSPGQSYLLIGCRSKRKASLYPQSDAAAFMERGKELQERHFTDVNAVVTTAVGLEKKAEIYAAQFSMDDTRLIAGERFTDTFVCFSVSGRTNVNLTQLWSMKLPDHRLVSSVPRWSVLGQDSLLSIVDQTAEVEVITRSAAKTSTAHKDKFKVGSALAWAVCDDRIALGGSFLREPRLSRVVQRADSGSITLEPVAVLPNAAKLRVSALAFVAPGAPAFNTRSYMIVFLENGIGTIYDVQTPSTQNTPQAVSGFADTDYAGHRVDAPLCILTAVRGQAYHEVLRIALLRGPNVTVYEQSGKADGGNFQMVRVADLYDVQEGDAVKHAAFLQNGLGLATSGHADGRHVRMFTLPSPGKAA
ncbi:hypothetical protein CGC21_21980 [Leishmania donovani]|uniref:Uncharacterized protein n=1 Tax=Leishmania donovani TaxID=5661 RepID=A0A504Y9G8_LEIDO|nr:hypothetical protein CGC21_21980 [Leishmania donovani]